MSGPLAPRTPPTAARFDPVADAYARGRPEYPAGALRRLVVALGLGPGARVVDLAAGTGKLTGSLRAVLQVTVLAIEPSPGMRAQFRRVQPDVALVAAAAEHLPLRDGRADAVVVGQAFHWFRGKKALAEIARVVRPRGGLAVLYNTRDTRVPWMARFSPLLHSVEPTGGSESRGDRWRAAFESGSPFEPLGVEQFEWTNRVAADGLLDLALSRSYVSALAPDARSAFAGRVAEFAATDPDLAGRATIDIPYVTELAWTRRRDDP